MAAVAVLTQEQLEELVERAVAKALSAREPVDDLPLTTAQAARVADVSPKTIRRWAASGRLRCTREGQEIRTLRVDVLRAKAGGGGADPNQMAAEHVAGLRRPS